MTRIEQMNTDVLLSIFCEAE